MANREMLGDWRWRSLALAATAPIAALGVSIGCLARNMVSYPNEFFFRHAVEAVSLDYGRLPGTGVNSAIATALLAVLMLFWFVALLSHMSMKPQSPLKFAAVGISLAIFAYTAHQTWLFGYPVCNPF